VTKVRMCVLVLVLIGLPAGAQVVLAQDSGTAKLPYLRVEWQLESTRGSYRNFCGRVYNDRQVPARTVIILFEGFDGAGQPVSRRFGEVIGGVQAFSYSIFCLLVPAGGTTYRVTVPTVDWGGAGQ
jgi:hypothetical protein